MTRTSGRDDKVNGDMGVNASKVTNGCSDSRSSGGNADGSEVIAG